MLASAPPRTFVPANLDVADFAQLEPPYRALLDRPIDSPIDMQLWLADLSELTAVVDEYHARRYIEKSCHTEDPELEKAYLHFVENIEPRIKPLFFELQKKFVASPHRAGLAGPKFRILERNWQADVEVFREQNVPLETQATKLVTQYDKIYGKMMVTYRGKELTLQQAARYLEEPDRPTRQEAWELIGNRRIQDRAPVEDIFDQLLELRAKIAANAGFGSYRDYVWKERKRFDYTPEQCLQFADAVAKTCVPLVDELNRQRQNDLVLNKLRPWDLAVDPKNRPPLRPFKDTEVPVFVQKVKSIFSRLSGELENQFDSLRQRNNLDLDSRKGKQPGGYQYTLEESRQPFIFMNAAGLHRDVETLLHEAGHAFHALEAASEDLVFLRHAPMEFCEVASMSMELLGDDHMDVFYNPADAARAKRTHLEGVIGLLPWIATIDSFQHWLYTRPGHTRQERTAEWLRLVDRFGAKVDWAGYEAIRESMWQRQLHLFHAPFYYIEYGIAQLGALQLWMRSKQDARSALSNYRAALRLAGTRTLPELFSAAGIRFDFSEKTIRPLMDAVGEELLSLPR